MLNVLEDSASKVCGTTQMPSLPKFTLNVLDSASKVWNDPNTVSMKVYVECHRFCFECLWNPNAVSTKVYVDMST